MITIHNNTIFNPKRGIQKYSQTKANSPSPLTQSFLTSVKTGLTKSSVIYRYYFLDSFINSDISLSYLNQLQADLTLLAQNNMTVLLRFAYKENFTEASTTNIPQQPTKNQILTHISQIAPILNNNVNSIMAFQMGFIGTWGEWYYTNSSEFGHAGNISSIQLQNRKDILDACLNSFNINIPLQLRYVKAYRDIANNNSRIGFYNDAFLNNWGDNGTFSVSSSSQSPVNTNDYNFLKEITKSTFMTGETNAVNSPRTDINNALVEMNLSNWDTLNDAYHPTVINSWKSSTSWNDIVNKLGYRFQVENANFNLNNNVFNYSITINNVGFAPLKFDKEFKIVAVKNGIKTLIRSINLKGIKGTYLIEGSYNTDLLEGEYQIEFECDLEFANLSNSLFYNLITNNNIPVEPEIISIDINLNLTRSSLISNGFTNFKIYNSSNILVGTNPSLTGLPRGKYQIKCIKNNINFNFTTIK
jgi:hypothetical protein